MRRGSFDQLSCGPLLVSNVTVRHAKATTGGGPILFIYPREDVSVMVSHIYLRVWGVTSGRKYHRVNSDRGYDRSVRHPVYVEDVHEEYEGMKDLELICASVRLCRGSPLVRYLRAEP